MGKLLFITQSPMFYPYLFFAIIYFVLFLLLIIVFYKKNKADKIRQNFAETVKPGDDCKMFSGRFNEAKIIEVDGDEITVIMTVHKNNIYPKF
jgi:preprotein translocase subunit YajC